MFTYPHTRGGVGGITEGHWRPLLRRWMAQGPCPLTRYSGVVSWKTTGTVEARRAASSDAYLPGVQGSGGHPSTADSWRPGASLDATGAMSSYPASRGRVGEDDSRLVAARRVAGYRRRPIGLPENTGSGLGTIAFVTCYMCLGVSLRQRQVEKCQDTFGHVPLNIATICACWSNPDSRILCWSVNLR